MKGDNTSLRSGVAELDEEKRHLLFGTGISEAMKAMTSKEVDNLRAIAERHQSDDRRAEEEDGGLERGK